MGLMVRPERVVVSNAGGMPIGIAGGLGCGVFLADDGFLAADFGFGVDGGAAMSFEAGWIVGWIGGAAGFLLMGGG